MVGEDIKEKSSFGRLIMSRAGTEAKGVDRTLGGSFEFSGVDTLCSPVVSGVAGLYIKARSSISATRDRTIGKQGVVILEVAADVSF